VETERLPRGADPNTHTKLGRGGLADVEWAVQLLQLRHAYALPELRMTRTLEALAAELRGRPGRQGRRGRDGPPAGRWPPRCATR
jgi:glutamate-ammonia-ligase adenylyltransferase